MRSFNLKKISLLSGFTLIEALVAISILMVAVAAPITIAQKGLSSAVYSKDQMIAAYLAQDAIEYIKNKRDEHAIQNANEWNLPNQFEKCIDNQFCQIDTTKTGDINNAVQSDSGLPLHLDDNNFYTYDGSTLTKFKRQINIKITKDGSDIEVSALVSVTVTWGPDKNNLTVKTVMYNF